MVPLRGIATRSPKVIPVRPVRPDVALGGASLGLKRPVQVQTTVPVCTGGGNNPCVCI